MCCPGAHVSHCQRSRSESTRENCVRFLMIRKHTHTKNPRQLAAATFKNYNIDEVGSAWNLCGTNIKLSHPIEEEEH